MRAGGMRSVTQRVSVVTVGFLMEAATVVAPMFFPVFRLVSSNLVGTAFVTFALGPVYGGLFALGTNVLLHYATGGGGPVGYVLAVRAIEAFVIGWIGRRRWGIVPDKVVSFHCGTGWRASETYFYAWAMGWPDIRVYDGGWYEWHKVPDSPRKPKGLPDDAPERSPESFFAPAVR